MKRVDAIKVESFAETGGGKWRRMLDAGYVAHVEQIGNVTAVF